MSKFDPLQAEVLRHRINEICTGMGLTLQRLSVSPNIRDRLDFSCAIYDATGRVVGEAAHIPVHLGSMGAAVKAAAPILRPAHWVMLNDPFAGGAHLPDITLVGAQESTSWYLAIRAHFADVGGPNPGSMAPANTMYEEGIAIPPIVIDNGTARRSDVLQLIVRNMRNPEERLADFSAMMAAGVYGSEQLHAVVDRYGLLALNRYADYAHNVGAERLLQWVRALDDGEYCAETVVEGVKTGSVVRVSVTIDSGAMIVDWCGSSDQVDQSINTVHAVAEAAVQFVVRSIAHIDAPCDFAPVITTRTRSGSIVDALPPAAVSAGNTEMSQVMVATLVNALTAVVPSLASISTRSMMNIAVGSSTSSYYETWGSGASVRRGEQGADGVHQAMTNTLNTPVEVAEASYPVVVQQYSLREDGEGNAGRGIQRIVRLLEPAKLSVMSQDIGGSGTASVTVTRANGSQERMCAMDQTTLSVDDTYEIRTSNGAEL